MQLAGNLADIGFTGILAPRPRRIANGQCHMERTDIRDPGGKYPVVAPEAVYPDSCTLSPLNTILNAER